MRRFTLVLLVGIMLCSCSRRESFVIVEESEFGSWQWEIENMHRLVNNMNHQILLDSYNSDYQELYYEIEDLKSKLKKLDSRIHKNFIHSDEIGSHRTRYFD